MAYCRRSAFFVSALLTASIMSGCSGGAKGTDSSALLPQTSERAAQSTLTSTAGATNYLLDGNFASPLVNGGYQYAPANPGPWRYDALNNSGLGPGGSGISANGTALTGANPKAPTSQVAFIQGGTSLSQVVNLPAGLYTFSTLAAARNGGLGGDPIRVSLDGIPQASVADPGEFAAFSPTSPSYVPESVTVEVPTSGTHTFGLQGLVISINNTTFLTNMALTPAPETATPPPTTLRPLGIAYPHGAAPSIPAQIEFSDYNFGGEGVAYHTQHTTNLGGVYRNDGVGIQKSSVTGGNGLNVGWMNPGDYYNYSFNVPAAGIYYVQFATASYLPVNTIGGELQIHQAVIQNGQVRYAPAYSPISVPGTGGWQNWTVTKPAQVQFPSAGLYTFSIQLLASTSKTFGVNVAYMTLATTPQVSSTPTPVPSPAFNNPSFETPNLNGGYQFAPTAAYWAFTTGEWTGAGISAKGTTESSMLEAPQDGSQIAFIKSTGSISQVVYNFQAGQSYAVSVSGEGSNNGITLLVDGKSIGNFQSGIYGSWSEVQSPTFTTTTGAHNITIQGTNTNGCFFESNGPTPPDCEIYGIDRATILSLGPAK